MKRKLPIGIQDFEKLRREGFCYVDKTAGIHELITGHIEILQCVGAMGISHEA
jgi:hypothetical protein